ncbi:MAG TPA: serine/threonine-protein kinase [Acidobacteriaceae bacterium]|jgi:serine/threonine-protein kinase
MPFQVGQRVGDYEVIQLLGAGGMGHVYKVRNIISNRAEAMKVLLPDLTAEPDLAMRFISEIRTLAGFDHPNIAQLHTALQADNQLIMMMEFVEGYTLEQLARQRSMPPAEVAGYVSQALAALGYAHERGVIHRDIKPANLMVTSHGIVKLMDFGIAKSNTENNQTKPGTTMGSLYYMSPEQVRGSGVDPRSDIYSVGIVLYELLAGRRPFEADTTFSILNQQLNVPPQPPIEVNPSLSPQLNQIILKALAKDPAQRFQSAEEFRTTLRPFVNAPSGQEIVQPITQSAPAPTPVPAYQQQQPAYEQQPAYSQQPQQQYGNPYLAAMPPPSSGGGRGLWIATGAIAVILALVGIGFAVPHFLHNNKASASVSTPDTSIPSATVTTTPATVATTPSHDTNTIQPSSPAPATTNPATNSSVTSNPATNSSATSRPPVNESVMTAHNAYPAGQPTRVGGRREQLQMADHGYAPAANSPVNGPPPADTRALDNAEERITQVRARARTAKRAVNQIRVQQEQQGLGMRGDIESAESRMDSYLDSANMAVNHGNAAKAENDLDKAEAELGTLEKFLGH